MSFTVLVHRLTGLLHRPRLWLVPGLLVLISLVLLLLRSTGTPAAQASLPSGGNIGIGVPCLRAPAPDLFAVTAFGNTLVDVDPAAPFAGKVSPDFPVLRLLTPHGEQATHARVADLGAVYGLAWDDGSRSGTPRLFLGSYARVLSGYGPGGPGAIYAYDPATGVVRHVATVNAGADAHGGVQDAAMRNAVGRTGLGDLEISPDGRRLYAMNLHTRTIAVFDITGPNPLRLPDIGADLDLIRTPRAPATLDDLYPFGMGFRPTRQIGAPATHSTDEVLYVGVIDTRARWASVPWYAGWEIDSQPFAHVIELNRTTGTQRLVVSQPLGDQFRMRGVTLKYRDGLFTWHPWQDTPTGATLDPTGEHIVHPTPNLSDIAFSADGETMFLGLRDRTGDQYFSRKPPGGGFSAIAQGDVLAYRRAGTSWTLLTTTTGSGDPSWDYLGDDRHDGVAHYTENVMGGLATRLRHISSGASLTFADDLVATTLVGSSTSGVRWYATGGGEPTHEVRTMHGAGKGSQLGDLEELCASAIVGERVWRDLNGNGIQDSGEPGIDGVQVDLTDSRGQLLASATTSSGGIFRFVVPPNRDDLVLKLNPANFQSGHVLYRWLLSPQDMGSDDHLDSDADEIARAIYLPEQWRDHRNATFAFGVMPPDLAKGNIGDFVWRDSDGDGQQDAGEAGINGVAVNLERCNNDSASCADGTWVFVDSMQTQYDLRDGWYEFSILPPGYYRVHFAVPAGATASPRDVGVDDRDSDADASSGWRTRTICVVNGHNPDPGCKPDHRTWDLGLVDDLQVTLKLYDMGLREITSGTPLNPLRGRTVAFASGSMTTNLQTDASRRITGAWATLSSGGQPVAVTPGIPTGMVLHRVTHDCAGATVDLAAGAVRGTRDGCELTFHYVLNPAIGAEARARTGSGALTDLPGVPVTLKGDTTQPTDARGMVQFTFSADQVRALVPQHAWTLDAPPVFGALRRTSPSPLTISPVQTSSGHRFIYEAPIQITLITTGMDGSETGRRTHTSITFTNGGRSITRTTDGSGQVTTQWIDTGDPTGTLTITPDGDPQHFISSITHDCGGGTTTDLAAGRISIPASSVAATATPGCRISVRSVPRPQIDVSVVGERTGGAQPLPNVPVQLLTATGSTIATASSDAGGQVSFTPGDDTLRGLVGAASAFWQLRVPSRVGALDLRDATPASRRQGSAPDHWLRLDPVQSSSDNRFVYGAEVEVRVVEHGTDGTFIRDLPDYRVDFVDRDDGSTTTRQTDSSGRIALRWLDVVDPGHRLELRPDRPDVSDPASRFLWQIEESAGCGSGTTSDLDAVWYRPTAGDGCEVTFVFVSKPVIDVQTVGRYADGTPIGACPSGHNAPSGTCPIPFLDVSWTLDGTPTSVIQAGRTARDGTFTFALTTDEAVRTLRGHMPLDAAGLYAPETVAAPWDPGNPVGILVEAMPGTHATAQSGPIHLRLSPVQDSPGNVFVYEVSPPAPPTASQDVRLWMHSRFDTASGPRVYLSRSQEVSWPAGEILDYTPHVTVTLHGQSPFPDHFAFASRTASWSYVKALVNGRDRLATGADDLNRADCRERDAPISAADADGLDGCAYVYLDKEQPLPDDLIYQGHLFFAANKLIALEPDVYAYQLAALEAVQLQLQVKSYITVEYVHTRPDGVQEVESLTRPQVDTGVFRIGLVVPRTVR